MIRIPGFRHVRGKLVLCRHKLKRLSFLEFAKQKPFFNIRTKGLFWFGKLDAIKASEIVTAEFTRRVQSCTLI